MARKRKATSKRKAAPRHNTTVVVAKTRHHKKRRAIRGTGAVGSTAVGKTTKKRKKRSNKVMGFSTSNLHLKDGVAMGIGIIGGMIVNKQVGQPLARKAAEHGPIAGKVAALLHAGVGLAIAVKGKNVGTKAFGITVMGGGVASAVQQFGVNKYIPGGLSGAEDDWTSVKIPMSGSNDTELTSMVAGLLTDNTTPNFNMVANSGYRRRHKQDFENTHSNGSDTGMHDYRLKSFVGESDFDIILPAKGVDY